MKVSIIIPCYNAENDIEECIDSAFAQTYQDIEVICIDNNSKDNTLSVLHDLKTKKYPNLIIDEEKKQGASAARNKGLKIAQGKWIQFLDADDLLLPKKIEHQVEIVHQKNTSLIAGSYKSQFLNGKTNEVFPIEEPWFGVFSTKFGITGANLWEKSILDQINGWNASLNSSQEYDLLFRYIQKSENVSADSNIGLIKRERTASISNQNIKGNRERFVHLRAQIIDFLKKEKPEYWKDNKEKFQQVFFDFLRTLYPFNSKIAVEYYKKYIPKDFHPKESAATTKTYLKIYNIFGFKAAELIKKLLKK